MPPVLETAIPLLCAHLVSDFVQQTDWIYRHKDRFGVLFVHVAVLVALSLTLLGALHWQIALLVAVSHLCADHIKTHYTAGSLGAFLTDPLFHLTVTLAAAALYQDAFSQGVWPVFLAGHTDSYLISLAVISGLTACAPAGGHLIGYLLAPFSAQLAGSDGDGGGASGGHGLESGGKYIGWLERCLVFFLVLTQNVAGIGFLITAKSILRIGEIKDRRDRKLAEYIIIGTFMSFGWALATAYATIGVIGLLAPAGVGQ